MKKKKSIRIISLSIVSLLLTMLTVYDQIFHRIGLNYIWDEQLRFHRWVIEGTSIDPWQYRVLAPYIIELISGIVQKVGLLNSYGRIFALVRLAQNFLIFVVAALYWRRLGINWRGIYVALPILAWGFTYSGYGSGLAFDTYFDLLFYLLAGFVILGRAVYWILPITILAAFNRDTGILIPGLLIINSIKFKPLRVENKRIFSLGILCMLLFLAIFIGIRLYLGPRAYSTAYTPGIELLFHNLRNPYTYFSIFATYSILPVMALKRWKRWPETLHRFFWLVVPVWITIHSFTALLAEARLFLVPYALILLPGVFTRPASDSDII